MSLCDMPFLEVPQPVEPATPIVPEPSPVPADPEPAPSEPHTPGEPVGATCPSPTRRARTRSSRPYRRTSFVRVTLDVTMTSEVTRTF